MGADELINVSKVKDQVEAVQELTGGRGVDVAIEATGIPEVWEKTMYMARKAGKVLLFGGCKPGTSITVPTELLHYSQLTLKGVFHTTPSHVEIAFNLITHNTINTNLLVSDELPLDKIVEALKLHMNQKAIKVAVIP